MKLSPIKRKALWLLPVAYTLLILPFLLLPWIDPVGSDFERIQNGMKHSDVDALLQERMNWAGLTYHKDRDKMHLWGGTGKGVMAFLFPSGSSIGVFYDSEDRVDEKILFRPTFREICIALFGRPLM